jgi:hypothetical protein
MALEDQIVALTAALNRNSDLLEGLTAKAKQGAAAATTESAPKAVAKDEGEEAPKRTRAAAKPAEDKPAKAVKAPTPADMADATQKFLDVEDEDEYTARRDLVKLIVAHFGAAKMSEIPENGRQQALDALAAYKAGDPTGFEEAPKRRSRDDDMA